jgi:UDP-N-acetylmuramate--alanine ligase
LNLTGRHNVLNALAVIALGDELGIDFGRIRQALGEFKGVERRFQIRHEDSKILIVDDYAHHPTEIAATIEAAKVCRRSRVVVVFQPHRYSRTKLLLDRFAVCFQKDDYLVVTDIYAAGEEPLEGVSGRLLADEIRRTSKTPVDYVDRPQLVAHVRRLVRPDDLVLFLGAGDITKASDEFAREFRK